MSDPAPDDLAGALRELAGAIRSDTRARVSAEALSYGRKLARWLVRSGRIAPGYLAWAARAYQRAALLDHDRGSLPGPGLAEQTEEQFRRLPRRRPDPDRIAFRRGGDLN